MCIYISYDITPGTVPELLTTLFTYFVLTHSDHDQLWEKWQYLLTNSHLKNL